MDGEGISSSTHDVSLGGMRLERAMALAPAMGSRVAIDLPQYGVSAWGIVKWSRLLPPGRVLVGVSFVHLAVAVSGLVA
jgi:hypothetical protein